jgi:hypothetical protein
MASRELEGLFAVAKNFEDVFFLVLVQGMAEQEHIGGIIFHHDDFGRAQFSPPGGYRATGISRVLTLDAESSVTVTVRKRCSI